MKRRQAKGNSEGGQHLAAMETELFRELAALVEHCAVRKYEDGEPRQSGWITLKTSGAAWVLQVKDPDSCCSFTAIADTLDKAFSTANLLLACEEAPWEPDTFLAKMNAPKKSK